MADWKLGIRTGSGRVGAGCLILFALPFAAVGVGTGIAAVRVLLDGKWGEGLFLGLFALTFGGAGFGMIAAAILGRRSGQREEERQAAHPDEPWLWKPEWADGRIRGSGKGGTIAMCLFALFWNLISAPLIVIVPKEVMEKQNYAGLIGALFPLVGIVLVVVAVRMVLRWRKYGASTFEMATVPGGIGGRLGGVIHTTVNVRPDEGFRVKLTCVNRVTSGSGDSRSTTEHIRWQEERVVGRELLADDPTRSAIPVLFTIPYDCPDWDDSNSDNAIVWRLEATAEVPGVDFHARFDVPVFHTPESSTAVTAADAAAESPELTQAPPAAPSRIVVTPLPGGVDVYYPPFRNPGATVTLGVFTFIWLGIVAGIIIGKAPVLFLFIFGAFGLLFVVMFIWMLLGATRVRVDRDGFTVRNSILGIGRTRAFALDDVGRVAVRIGMRAGSTVYYDLHVDLGGQKTARAGGGIRDKREAETLADALNKALGGTA